MLSSPIPPDPQYQARNGWSTNDTAPRPRVKPEAEAIAEKHRGSVGLLLQLEGQEAESRDYTKENVRKMRQIQSVNRRRREEEQRKSTEPVKALPQSEKYKTVPSKLAENLNQPPAAPRPSSANYLRSHSRPGTPEIRGRSVSPAGNRRPVSAGSARASSTDALDSPTAAELKLQKSDNVNYVALNARQTRYMQQRRSPSARAIEEHKKRLEEAHRSYKKGEVPSYLRSRQKQWDQEAEERRRNTPDPDMPPGHAAMPEKERLETLDVLKQKEHELTNELSRLSVTADTMRARAKRADLESRISEIEEAIKIFSRRKVFVKLTE
ncbi:enkurin domain-containing protein 1-like isoform X2 [Glandiceps talaboti]